MRDILFRGKRLDNGEWVDGNLIQRKNSDNEVFESHIVLDAYVQYGVLNIGRAGALISECGYECFKVDPETVSQYTGLTDCNGNKIWENDIILGIFLHGLQIKSVCKFKDGSFGAEWFRGDVKEFSPFTSCCNVQWEVLGNVFDNPELIKEAN